MGLGWNVDCVDKRELEGEMVVLGNLGLSGDRLQELGARVEPYRG